MIPSTFKQVLKSFRYDSEYFCYLLQIYQQLSEYDFVGVHYCLVHLLLDNFKVSNHMIIGVEILIVSEMYLMPKYRVL